MEPPTEDVSPTSSDKVRESYVAKQIRWKEDGLSFEPDSLDPISMRMSTINHIIPKLESFKVILVRSQKYTGKTSLLQLIHRHLNLDKQNNLAIYLNHLEVESESKVVKFSYEDWWEQKTHKSYMEWREDCHRKNRKLYLLLDETQLIYANDVFGPFWNWVRSVQSGQIENVYILMFAAYPVFQSINAVPSTPTTAIQIEHKFCASFIMSYGDEHEELIEDFNNKTIPINSCYQKRLFPKIEGSIKDTILGLARLRNSGNSYHICLIKRILTCLVDYFADSRIENPLPEAVIKVLTSADFMDKISNHRGGNTDFTFADPDIQRLIGSLLREGIIILKEKDSRKPQVLELAKRGIVHFTRVDEERPDEVAVGEIGFLTMYTWIQCFSSHDLAVKQRINDEFSKITLKEFLKSVISKMDYHFVENTLGVLSKKDADGNKRTPSERSYQMEFYRCVYSCLPPEFYCHPDYGLKSYLDFYIDSTKNWAIELVAEGDDVPGHVARFNRTNKYSLIPTTEKLVLDFRYTKSVRNFVPGAWHLCYDKEVHSFNVVVNNAQHTKIDAILCETFTIPLRDSRLSGITAEYRSTTNQLSVAVSANGVEQREIKVIVAGRKKPARVKVLNEKIWEVIKLACIALEIPGYAVYSLQKHGITLDDDAFISDHIDSDNFSLAKDAMDID